MGNLDICRFGLVYNTLQPRLTKTLLNALLDPKKALTQHYGAIQGLAALGPNVVISFLMLYFNQTLLPWIIVSTLMHVFAI